MAGSNQCPSTVAYAGAAGEAEGGGRVAGHDHRHPIFCTRLPSATVPQITRLRFLREEKVMQWDPGPPPKIATLFDQAPLANYQANPARFRLEWGPIFYRGRLDGSAKVLVIGQDPSVNENVARRILVGDAGQRVQRYLGKLGLTRSYVMVNSILYSITGQFDREMQAFTDVPAVRQWRNSVLDSLATRKLKAVLAFGAAARHVVDTWPGAAALAAQGRVFYLLHPTARPESKVLADWSSKLREVSAKVPADPDGTRDLSPYAGSSFGPADLASIPLFDFSFGTPSWMGTGDTAARKTVSGKQAILWTAIGDEG